MGFLFWHNPNGEKLGVKKIDDALTLANYAGLDLVLMSSNAFNLPTYLSVR